VVDDSNEKTGAGDCFCAAIGAAANSASSSVTRSHIKADRSATACCTGRAAGACGGGA
jgi:hypothetical protein